MKKILSSVVALSMIASATTASAAVRPASAIPAVATSTSSAAAYDYDEGFNDIYWVIGFAVLAAFAIFLVAGNDDGDGQNGISLG